MAVEVIMPRQGQSVESCLILEWKKSEGERVEAQEILCAVETDKASFDIEAPADGVLLKTLYNEGSDVQVRPVEGVRRVISKHLHTSLPTTAQYTLNTSAVAESILSYRKRLQKAPESSGQRNISLNDLLMAL